MDVLIEKEDGRFQVRQTDTGYFSVPVGRGRTILESLGDWLLHNHSALGVKLSVDPSAASAVTTYEQRKLAQR